MRKSVHRLCIVAATSSTTLSTKTTPSHKVSSISDPSPTPAEAPHLLEQNEERKPFISAKQFKAFTGSLVVGAVSMGTVYTLLSKHMCNCHAEEVALADCVARSCLSNTEKQQQVLENASVIREKVVGTFVAPSSFAQLKAKANEESQRKLEQQPATTDATSSNTMLHDEFLFRAKTFWNESITNVQLAVDQFEAQYRERRRMLAVQALEDRLKEEMPGKNFKLVKL